MKRILAFWKWWRLDAGLRAAAIEAFERAYSHPNAKDLGPELNLSKLFDDLNGERRRLYRLWRHP